MSRREFIGYGYSIPPEKLFAIGRYPFPLYRDKPDRAESFASPTDRYAIANGCPCISKPVGIEVGSDAGAFGKPCGE